MSCLDSLSFIMLIMIHITLITSHITIDYENTINYQAQQWASNSISQATISEKQTIIDLLLLSYQIVQASCHMIIAKFTIQQEVFKIYTPSFIDSWQDNLQINQNDTTKLEQALLVIKQSQIEIKEIYKKFKQLVSDIVKINPQPTQILISDLKILLLSWGKLQQSIPNDLLNIQQEFTQALSTIPDIKNFLATVCQLSELKHIYLKEAADFFSKTYKDIDDVIKHFIYMRIQNIFKIQSFFESFFKEYYKAIYQNLTTDEIECIHISATDNKIIPAPDAFFC